MVTTTLCVFTGDHAKYVRTKYKLWPLFKFESLQTKKYYVMVKFVQSLQSFLKV